MLEVYADIIELCEVDNARLDLRSFSKSAGGISQNITLRYCPKCRAYESRSGMIKNARVALKANGYRGRFKAV